MPFEALQTTISVSDTLSSGDVNFIFKSYHRLIELASISGVDMIEWTDDEKKAYRREFKQTCKNVFDDDFEAQLHGCNVLHHAVKAGNGTAVLLLKEFYTRRVNTDVNAWQEYMSILDATDKSVSDNAPYEAFKVWLDSLKPVETLFDGYGFTTTATTTQMVNMLVKSDSIYNGLNA